MQIYAFLLDLGKRWTTDINRKRDKDILWVMRFVYTFVLIHSEHTMLKEYKRLVYMLVLSFPLTLQWGSRSVFGFCFCFCCFSGNLPLQLQRILVHNR